jgi:hypothetical protein
MNLCRVSVFFCGKTARLFAFMLWADFVPLMVHERTRTPLAGASLQSIASTFMRVNTLD